MKKADTDNNGNLGFKEFKEVVMMAQEKNGKK